MSAGRLMAGVVLLSTSLLAGGCATMEELQQVQMAQRNLEREKAALEQELYDSRTVADSMRARGDSLADQMAVKDQLIANLGAENDGLEEKFRKAQNVLEKIADRPVGAVNVGPGKLPEELDAALRRFASDNPSSVSYDGAQGTLKWTSDLVFAFASDVVKDTAAGSLGTFGQIMNGSAGAGFDVIVVGHTDSIPIRQAATKQKHPTNVHLSVHRSIAVAKVLEQHRLSGARIGVMGFGSHRPIAPNDSEAGRARNRRVEMYIVPAGAFSVGADVAAAAITGAGTDPTK